MGRGVRWFCRLWVVFALGLAGAFIAPVTVFAHAYVISSNPAASQSFQKAPTQVEVQFDENVQLSAQGLTVTDEDGKRVDSGDGKLDPANHHEIICHLPASLPKGVYTIHWQVVSADGHTVEGTIPFGVQIDVKSLHLGATQTGYTPGAAMLIDRTLEYIGMALVIGLALFFRFIWPASAGPAMRGWRRKLVYAAWALLAIGIAFSLPVQTAITWNVHGFASFSPRDLLRTLNLTLFGYVWIVQMLLLLIAPPVLSALLNERIKHRWWWILTPVFCFPITKGLIGHAVAENSPQMPVVADVIHLYAASIWVGGLTGMVLLMAVWIRSKETMQKQEIAMTVRRFSMVASASVIALAVTGFYTALLHIPTWYALFHTGYGQALVVKLTLFIIMLLLAAVHWTRRKRLRMQSFRRLVLVELVVGLGIFFVASILTNLPTGMSDPGPVHMRKTVEGTTMALSITPNQAGNNQFTVRLTGDNGQAVTAVQQVTLSFSSSTVAAGSDTLRLNEKAPGVYSVDGLALSGGGRWHVEIDVLTDDYNQLDGEFSFAVGQ